MKRCIDKIDGMIALIELIELIDSTDNFVTISLKMYPKCNQKQLIFIVLLTWALQKLSSVHTHNV